MLAQSLAVARRVLVEYRRQRRVLVFWAVFPALMLLLFGLIYRHNPAMRGAFEATPGGILIGAALFFSSLGGTVSLIAAERERRTLRRLLITPLGPGAYVLGIVLAQSVVAAGQALIVVAIAWAMDAPYRGSVALGLLVVALSVAGYVGLGLYFGARFARRAEDVMGPLSAFGVPLLVLGGSFFPLTLLPDALLRVAWFDPVLHMNEAMRGVAVAGRGASELAPDLAFLVAFAAFSMLLGMAAYRRMLREEQRG
jgi:ABC-2 type transport system permease protein